MPGKKRKVLNSAEQYLEAFEKALVAHGSASEAVTEAEDEMLRIVKDAKTALPSGDFQDFKDDVYVPDYLVEELEDALTELDERHDKGAD